MRLRIRVFGRTAISVTLDAGQPEYQEDEPPQGITGGPDLYTERDPYPPDPTGEEPWTDRRLGFR